ncbi:hypothetical protein [Clostridium cochlearium]|jgi:hypothetical protein|uniref:Uncharacterized protein n=1 Tax=Clostridium cochlearium TaxID=1494 RepID=A0A240AWR2_CLOCO|nr:hypothetical protein [Clostridium cochlearium]MBV1818886.1 hypothetical protein [Bacteroidales bacterium MSK.15.36]NSJ91154.1 hypothetical protein [Coprococcus sp. MSK.21.13]MBE6065848.1 hypothetical protein [Clostridium cochlearium]MBU5268646.1 hypothetical protein [Clostridium cochlearium]MCG4571647.1 hypothetical protein [Clostridium cochlearium]
MSKKKKHKKNRNDMNNNMNDNLMDLINNLDLEQVMSLLSGGNNVNTNYDEENTQIPNKNLFNDPTIQLINMLRPIVENNRESIEKLLQVYFLSRLINKK